MRLINETKYESPRDNEARKQFLKNKRDLMWNSDMAFDNPEEFDKNQKELIKAYNKETPKRKIAKNLFQDKFEEDLNGTLGINTEALKQGNLEKAKQIQTDIEFYEEKDDDQPYNSYKDKLDNLYQQLDESSNQLKDMAKHNKKKQKGKGWFVKLNAGNPEYNASFFNRAMGNDTTSSSETSSSETSSSEGTGLAENIEPRQINIRQSLIELDKEDPDFLGTLSTMYDYLEPDLTIEDKKELIDLINKHDNLKIFNFLNNKMDVYFDYEIHEEEID